MQHVTRLCLVAVALAGCGGNKPPATLACAPPECAADESLTLAAEVDPASGSPLVQQEFGGIDLDPQTGQFVLTLAPQVTLTGAVRVGAGATAQKLAATVVATRPSRIPGRPDVFYQTMVDATTGQYTLVVSPNQGSEIYSVRVTPADATLVPPKVFTVSATADQALDLTFEDPLTLPELHGTVLDSLQVPVAGMQVQASDPTSGRVISTTAVTDDRGAYALRLQAALPPMVLVTAVPTDSAPGALPSLALPVATDKLGPANTMTANLQVPPLPAVATVTYNVSGTSSSGADTPVVGATCIFTADVSDPHATDGLTATYRAVAMTDADGNATLDLIPADASGRTYAVTITPDASSSFAATSTSLVVGPQGGYGPSIILPLRPVVSGRVFDPKGLPVRGLTVVPSQATLAAALGPSPLSVVAAPPQAVADADGRFAVRLDKGVWDIGLVPPPTTELPRLWLTDLSIEGDVDVTGAGGVMLPLGVMVKGLVQDASGAPVAHANVRLYTVAPGNANCKAGDAGCLAPPRLRAEGSTGPDGAVGLILPSQPQ